MKIILTWRQLGYLLVALICFIPTPAAATEKLYIAPTGRDTWTGRLDAPNRDHTDGPLATLERARDIVRKTKHQHQLPAGGIIVELAAGTYQREETFEL